MTDWSSPLSVSFSLFISFLAVFTKYAATESHFYAHLIRCSIHVFQEQLHYLILLPSNWNAKTHKSCSQEILANLWTGRWWDVTFKTTSSWKCHYSHIHSFKHCNVFTYGQFIQFVDFWEVVSLFHLLKVVIKISSINCITKLWGMRADMSTDLTER